MLAFTIVVQHNSHKHAPTTALYFEAAEGFYMIINLAILVEHSATLVLFHMGALAKEIAATQAKIATSIYARRSDTELRAALRVSAAD